MKITREELRELVIECIRELIEEQEADVDEVSTTASVPGYNIPKAFVKKRLSDKMSNRKDEMVNEVSYREFKKDPRTNSRKIGEAIRDVNRKLIEVERLLKHSAKLKKEADVSQQDLWKKTRGQLQTLEGRVLRTAQKIRELRT